MIAARQSTWTALLAAALLFLACLNLHSAESISILIGSNAAPRIEFGAQKLADALHSVCLDAVVQSNETTGSSIYIPHPRRTGRLNEGFWLHLSPATGSPVVSGEDDSGTLYGCLELAARIRAAGQLPASLDYRDQPVMRLRGTCIGMQKTYILPGRKVYEYPYSPELFPWFYDKTLWREYLDFMAENRFNSLYLWNGHPFASLVRLPDYPDAIEVPEPTFKQNVDMFRWLATECDRRGIWLVQMFYNILLPKPLADKHGLSTQLAAPTPLASDYTRKAIAEFVKQYPNVGLMVCLGEALQDASNQVAWATQTILPGIHDGMRAAGLSAEPPVVIRTHAMDAEAVMPACFQVYSNLFTETKYNGESLTTYEPRGKNQATHQAMARLGPHLVNVHILSNLEPFRYGAQHFIQRCVQASRDRLGACGLHLYPLAYWNWPYSPDIADPPLKQWDRDWIWFAAWARYAWNPDLPEPADRAYWISRLADYYGTQAAAGILDAYNAAGEVAPALIRRFGITEGNRQTLALGMTLDQLVNPKKYGAIEDLWLSQAPPGERLDEYVQKEWDHQAHTGETPFSVLSQTRSNLTQATRAIEAAAPGVTSHHAEFKRLQNDIACLDQLGRFYECKVNAAARVLRFDRSHDLADLDVAASELARSGAAFAALCLHADSGYRFANSMQTSHRKIPFVGAINGVATNYLWTQILPLYAAELVDFQAHLAERKQGGATPATNAAIQPWPAAKFQLLNTNAQTYDVQLGARPFADRPYTILELAPELNGLVGIRFSHEAAKNGHYEPIEFQVDQPVRVLIGYFQDPRDIWRQVPNLDVASHADEHGGIDVLLRNAATIDHCPALNVHAFRYGAGRHKLDPLGKGSFVILGVVPQSLDLKPRDLPPGAQR